MQFDRSRLISEMPGPTGQLVEQTNVGEGGVKKGVVNRDSLERKGEEFVVELGRDHAMRLPVNPVMARNHDIGSLAMNRMDSGCNSRVVDSACVMGLMENGIHVNNGCGVPSKDTAVGKEVKITPVGNICSGVQHLTDDSASWQGLKKTSNVNQSSSTSSASAPNLTELDVSQSSQHYRGISEGSQSGKVKFLCSSGGKILPRPSDGKLRYVGGETRMISIGNGISWAELVQKTYGICNQPHTIKYQLPGEELDALISVSSDEDLQNMIDEYYSGEKRGGSQRLQIFLIPLTDSENVSAVDVSAVQQVDPDYQYVVAVNGVTRVNSTLSDHGNEQSVATSTLGRNTSFQENTLSSQSPRSVTSINAATRVVNEPLDMIRQPIQCASVAPVTVQQRDMKNEISLLHNSELSPEGIQVPPLINTAKSPTEINSNSVPLSHNDANKSGAIQTDTLSAEVPHMNCPATEILPTPVLELSGHNMPECSFDRPVVEERVFSENPLSRPDDTMNVFCESNDPIPMSYGMPHAFSDSKLQEYGGSSTFSSQEVINPYFSLNFSRPPLSVTADLLQNHTQRNEDVGLSNPHLKSNIPIVESIVRNQGPNLIDFSFGSQLDKDIQPVPWDISINQQSHQPVNSELTDDTIKQFGDKMSTSGPVETPDMLDLVSADQSFYVDVNNQQYSMQVSGGLAPPSVSMKPSTGSPRGESDSNQSSINSLKTADVVNNYVQTPKDVNLVTDLLPGLCSSLVSVESFVHQPFACTNNMEIGNFLMNCTQSPSSAVIVDKFQNSILHHIETDNVDQNAYVRREYSLIDDDWIGNNNHNLKLDASDHCTGNLEKIPAVVADGLNCPVGGSYSGTTQHQMHAIHADDPSLSTTEVENTLEELVSANEHFDDGSNNKQITDAMVAEMEADVYGLQIIKNADLEDLRELGSGTFGTVYHGRWRGTDVAIKRIRKKCFSGRLSEQERLIKDFWKEARMLSNLHHPNVVAFYGVVPDGAGGTLATVTEYMSHGSLRSVLVKKDRFLDHRKKLIIAMDSAFGMEYLHSKNIIHFDLKCDNLLVSLRDPERPVCKVGDFGLSKIKRNTLVSGGVRGTLPWMAPELLNGCTDLVSEKVDVFSFGISMWEILTGEEPYTNMHYGAIIGGIVKNTLRPSIPEGCDPEWRILMEQCWSTNPEQRPSFTEIANRLRSMYAVLHAKGKGNQQPKA